MGDVIIDVRGLSKRFNIPPRQESYRTLRDSITEAVSAPARRLWSVLCGRAPNTSGGRSIVWALKDVSFQVRRGEVLGIVGRNGSGKSTLLKIISRITAPTQGEAFVRGRVGSLLEVGTGFHFELSGRENIYLYGAVLGMRKREIHAKFEEIVEFSQIGDYLDAPVKHYSSGMYMRLAFSVAANLESDILLVDEVLAVGDQVFQEKCLQKMREMTAGGRTVLFVSHNCLLVERLCHRAILLVNGALQAVGPAGEVVRQYLPMPPSHPPCDMTADATLSAYARAG